MSSALGEEVEQDSSRCVCVKCARACHITQSGALCLHCRPARPTDGHLHPALLAWREATNSINTGRISETRAVIVGADVALYRWLGEMRQVARFDTEAEAVAALVAGVMVGPMRSARASE